jgi:hypothetical protein
MQKKPKTKNPQAQTFLKMYYKPTPPATNIKKLILTKCLENKKLEMYTLSPSL